jgi:hypothetical protein
MGFTMKFGRVAMGRQSSQHGNERGIRKGKGTMVKSVLKKNKFEK